MAWRKPPKIAPKQLKRTAAECPDPGAAAAAAAARADACADEGGSRLDRLSRPKTNVEKKARRNPKEIREAALAKKIAKAKGQDAAETPRVRTTVTKTKSRPDGASETTTVEKVASGPAAPRYNKKKVMHPADEYKMSRRPIPKKPTRRCPRIKPKTVYPKEVRELWEDWQRYNDFQEEVKCWKINQPYLTAEQKEQRRFAKWLKKEEDTHEAMWKAGRTNIKPFHLRGADPGAPKKAKPLLASASVKELPKTPTGKRRYLKKDAMDNYIRYNSVGDPHPEDVFTSCKGGNVPEYVHPPLNEDGTYKKPKDRTKEETEALIAYRRWEEFYFKVQSWESDKKWVGDPRLEELWKIKTVSGPGGSAPNLNTAEGRAQARANDRARRAGLRSGSTSTKAAASAAAAMKKMGGGKLTGAAKVALQSLARREAKEAAAKQAKADAIAARQRSFLKSGARETPKLGRGKIDVSRVRSRIGEAVRASRAQQQELASQLEVPFGSPIQVTPPPPAEPCSPPFIPPRGPPLEVYHAYERKLGRRGQMRQSRRNLAKMAEEIGHHMSLTGNIEGIQLARRGMRPASHHPDSTIFPFDPRRSILRNFGTPEASSEGGPPMRIRQDCAEGSLLDRIQQVRRGMRPVPRPEVCAPARVPMSQSCAEPEIPLTPLGWKSLRSRGLHPSPPKSISKGRLPHQPMHPYQRMVKQFRTAGDDIWLAEHELELPEERAYADQCLNYEINRPLRERREKMAAATDIDLLHPTIFRSSLQERMKDARSRQRKTRRLSALSQRIQSGGLPAICRQPVTRMASIPSPPCSPQIPVDDLLGIDEPPCDPPPTPPLPPPALSPSPCRPPPPRTSPFELPARFIPEMNNPYLQVAQRSIASVPSNIPYRGQEIADTYARVQKAAEERRPEDLMTPWEYADMCRDIVDCQDMDNALEGVQLTPPGAGAVEPWHFPDYHQCEGPMAGMLYHEHSRRPQLGPWHYTPPGGRQRYHDWEGAAGQGACQLVDIPNVIPKGPRSRGHCV